MLSVFFIPLFAQAATIKIDIDRKIGEIDPKIYGVFMEPIHFDPAEFGGEILFPENTLYGTLYNPESPNANEDGFDKNFIAVGQELKITNMRWPGGNYVAGYNWQDGIGPKEKRPVRIERLINLTRRREICYEASLLKTAWLKGCRLPIRVLRHLKVSLLLPPLSVTTAGGRPNLQRIGMGSCTHINLHQFQCSTYLEKILKSSTQGSGM